MNCDCTDLAHPAGWTLFAGNDDAESRTLETKRFPKKLIFIGLLLAHPPLLIKDTVGM